MKPKWTGDLVGKMHRYEVTLEDLANECGYVKGYVSMILNGHRSPEGCRDKLETAFNAIVERRQSD